MCKYKLLTYWQNFMEIYSTGLKILPKVLGGYYFLTHTVDSFIDSSLSKSLSRVAVDLDWVTFV